MSEIWKDEPPRHLLPTYTLFCLLFRYSEERSQLANKIKALSRLKAKLLVIAEEQRASEIKQIRGDAVKAEWGQQIRNYVFHPYKLVKDVRTGYETSDINSVMDGDLESFIKAYLKYKYATKVSEGNLGWSVSLSWAFCKPIFCKSFICLPFS